MRRGGPPGRAHRASAPRELDLDSDEEDSRRRSDLLGVLRSPRRSGGGGGGGAATFGGSIRDPPSARVDPYVEQLEAALRESVRRYEALARKRGLGDGSDDDGDGGDEENNGAGSHRAAQVRELNAQLALYKKENEQLRRRVGGAQGPEDSKMKEDLARRAFEAAWHRRKASRYEEVKRERDELQKEVEALRRQVTAQQKQTVATAKTLDARISGLQASTDAAADHNRAWCVVS